MKTPCRTFVNPALYELWLSDSHGAMWLRRCLSSVPSLPAGLDPVSCLNWDLRDLKAWDQRCFSRLQLSQLCQRQRPQTDFTRQTDRLITPRWLMGLQLPKPSWYNQQPPWSWRRCSPFGKLVKLGFLDSLYLTKVMLSPCSKKVKILKSYSDTL